MSLKLRLKGIFLGIVTALSIIVCSAAQAQSNDFRKPGSHSGVIIANRHFINRRSCGNDRLNIFVRIPRSLRAFWNGEADLYMVIATPEESENGSAEFLLFNLRELLGDALEEDTNRPIFELSCDFLNDLAPGSYQLAIVMTIFGGNPENLEDWYRGFRGLIAVSRIKIGDDRDEEDSDEDGELDGDTNGDGLIDDSEEEPEDEVDEQDEGEPEEESEEENEMTEDDEMDEGEEMDEENDEVLLR